MQLKTTMRQHLTPVRIFIINKTRNKSVGKDVKKMGHSFTAGGNSNWCSHYEKWYADDLKN